MLLRPILQILFWYYTIIQSGELKSHPFDPGQSMQTTFKKNIYNLKMSSAFWRKALGLTLPGQETIQQQEGNTLGCIFEVSALYFTALSM